MRLVVEQLEGAVPERRDEVDDDLGQVGLQGAVPAALVLLLEGGDRAGRRARSRCVSRLLMPGFSSGSNRISEPESVTADRIFLALTGGVVEQPDAAVAADALRHLLLHQLEVVDLRGRPQDVGLGQPEGLLVAVVEPLGEVAGELEVLALVLADGHEVRAVEQDVGGLEHRVGEQPDAGGALAALGRLVLELGHPPGLAEAGQALEHPAQLRVGRDVALDEDRRPVRVHAHREQLRGGDAGVRSRSSFGSCSTVIACMSATKKNGW